MQVVANIVIGNILVVLLDQWMEQSQLMEQGRLSSSHLEQHKSKTVTVFVDMVVEVVEAEEAYVRFP